MKLNVYVFRNATLECSGNPIFDDHEPDVFVKQLERQLMTAPEEKLVQYTNVSFYHIAVYDDESMRMEPLKDPVLLLDCNLAVEKRKIKLAFVKEAQKILSKKDEVKKDVK